MAVKVEEFFGGLIQIEHLCEIATGAYPHVAIILSLTTALRLDRRIL